MSLLANVRHKQTYNKMRMHRIIVSSAKWNIRILYMAGKLANLEVERSRLNIDILRSNGLTLKNRRLVGKHLILRRARLKLQICNGNNDQLC